MVFCAYCGKSFTRKEHLERHIPSHTNVKPHRCSACQLSFARRDLLQRHHATYHEARDHLELLPGGGAPTISGRQPIACLNCAQAKTGCDKRVPCARCADKNLPCSARFARRSSKIRAAQARAQVQAAAQVQAQANAALQNQLGATLSVTQRHGVSPQPSLIANFNSMDIEAPSKSDVSSMNASGPPTMVSGAPIDPRLQASPVIKKTHTSPRCVEGFSSPHNRMDALDEFMQVSPPEFACVTEPPSFQDMLVWPDYSLDMDMYGAAFPLAATRAEISLVPPPPPPPPPPPIPPPIADFSDISTVSEAVSSRDSVHTRNTSITTTEFDLNLTTPSKTPVQSPPAMVTASFQPGSQDIPEFEVVVAAENAWPLARCTPPIFSGSCPRTAIVHLECLEQKSKQDGTWQALEKYLESADCDKCGLASVVPLTQRTRDKMLAITQSFLHKALDIHRGGRTGASSRFGSPAVGGGSDWNFLVLPENKILECFLRSYSQSLRPYYNLVATGCVDPNEMLKTNQASTLLVLLMIAQGASMVPMAEARFLAAGLTETCRINLFDIIEKDVELSADPVMLRCALLFAMLGSWSGDKWLMDIAMGQRGMYLSMLRHAGMLERWTVPSEELGNSPKPELHWQAWLKQEGRSRLVYNWVMFDQELSLFHDTVPQLSITDLQCPLPGSNALWTASTAEAWLTESVCPANSFPSSQPSLHDLFQDFLNDKLSGKNLCCAQRLRLLLHPLQSMLCHLRQLLSCVGEVQIPPALSHNKQQQQQQKKRSSGNIQEATLARLQQLQCLLQKWYDSTSTLRKESPECEATKTMLVLYHLVSLNAITNFPEAERLARKEGFASSAVRADTTPSPGTSSTCPEETIGSISPRELIQRASKCIHNRCEALFHAGQTIKLLREVDQAKRPAWWTAAVYRAALILWVDVLMAGAQSLSSSSSSSSPRTPPRMTIKNRRTSSSSSFSSSSSSLSSQLGDDTVAAAAAAAAAEGTCIPIDALGAEDPALLVFRWHGKGLPVVSPPAHAGLGSVMRLTVADQVLVYARSVIEEGMACRLGDGIRRKLAALGRAWDGSTVSSAAASLPAGGNTVGTAGAMTTTDSMRGSMSPMTVNIGVIEGGTGLQGLGVGLPMPVGVV